MAGINGRLGYELDPSNSISTAAFIASAGLCIDDPLVGGSLRAAINGGASSLDDVQRRELEDAAFEHNRPEKARALLRLAGL